MAKQKGFTLVELMVVMSIIGILAAALTTGLNPLTQFKKGRDTRRQSDLSQYRNALETYSSSKTGTYPVGLTTIAALCSALSPDFITSCPSDPGTFTYRFYSSANGLEYLLSAQLEMNTDGNNDYWEICSSGKSGLLLTAPATWDSSCDL